MIKPNNLLAIYSKLHLDFHRKTVEYHTKTYILVNIIACYKKIIIAQLVYRYRLLLEIYSIAIQ